MRKLKHKGFQARHWIVIGLIILAIMVAAFLLPSSCLRRQYTAADKTDAKRIAAADVPDAAIPS